LSDSDLVEFSAVRLRLATAHNDDSVADSEPDEASHLHPQQYRRAS
jgi:hypothetical protein